MKALRLLAPIIAGLVIVLTYFLVQGTTINTPRHERAEVLQAVVLYDAALQRDVLLARAGLLPNYDPLVRSMENLLMATADLPAASEIASGAARADIERKIAEVTKAVGDQEALVEAFKSDNALLQNSLSYFNHLSGQLTSGNEPGRAAVEAEVGVLTTGMLRYINAPRPDTAGEIEVSLDRLERLASEPADDIHSLVTHGRLVVAMFPRVDDLVSRIQAAPTSELAHVLQSAYFEAHARVAARADVFMALLYVAALALVAYVGYLFVRLRASTGILRTRLEFEGLVASISTQFINLPRNEIRTAVRKALAELAEHANVAGARIIMFRGAEADGDGSYSYQHDAASTAISPERMLELIRHWTAKGYERQGCLNIADAAVLPDGEERAALWSAGIRTWLCIPMRIAGECLGVLVFHDPAARRWHDDDISLMRTVAEIFANAIARERSESEREELQAQLNRSQRLEAIGTFAGGIAHEFNNILGAIRGYSEMALAVLLKDSHARRHVLQIMKAGERAQHIVEQVLAFGRRREREHRPVSAGAVIAEAVDLVRASLPATLSLRTGLAAEDAVLMGDPTELQQVVMNLCTNAAQAMDGRGVLRIGLDTIAPRRTLGVSHGSLPAGRYIRLKVRDSGHGIDQATMERIFEPFFTTKRAGQGTGLGLSTVHGIVSAHHGAINVKSKPGKGTTFEVYFPRIEQEIPEEEAPETPVRNGHGETVLIVDDDKPLVLLGEEMLAALGYEPVGFDRGRAALAAFRADPARFDLVLTDEVMPEVTGTELAGAMHDIRPDIPIVLMTGYDGALQPDRLRSAGIREVLEKPLLSRSLADCLSRQLAG
ncbi:MAG TPA: two-component system VirA-like sensor kinase [Pseudaminobacter sp.]|nr:two-component system VirA-like sensor kinase [Pseudaminobacter sp.]